MWLATCLTSSRFVLPLKNSCPTIGPQNVASLTLTLIDARKNCTSCCNLLCKDRVRAWVSCDWNLVSRADRSVRAVHWTTETHSTPSSRRPLPLPRNHRSSQQPALWTNHATRHRTGKPTNTDRCDDCSYPGLFHILLIYLLRKNLTGTQNKKKQYEWTGQ